MDKSIRNILIILIIVLVAITAFSLVAAGRGETPPAPTPVETNKSATNDGQTQ